MTINLLTRRVFLQARVTGMLLKSLALAVSIILLVPFVAHAQTAPVTWSEPVKLSGDYEILFPTVAADPYGGVHVFWVQGVEPGAPTDAVFTVHWDGSAWSTPNDILVAPYGSGLTYDMPRATADKEGTIYLVWVATGTVLFSSAPATMSSNAQAWAAPVDVMHVGLAHLPQIAVDDQGTVHVAVANRLPGGNVQYTQSTDGGVTWSDAVPVSLVSASAPQTPDTPRLLVDRDGTIHVFWTENYPPEYVGRELYYARSVDGGNTWSLPTLLSFSESQEDWDARPAVALDASGRLHVIWVCGQVERCYRWSQDHGATWSEAQKLFNLLVGSGGWDAMTADGYGSVYWVGSLRFPAAFYASWFNNERWQEPPQPAISGPEHGELNTAHRPQAVIGLGNKLHTVMVEEDAGPVWYMSGLTTGAEVAPLPLPLPLPTVTPSATAALTATVATQTELASSGLLVSANRGADTLKPGLDAFSRSRALRVPVNATAVSVASVLVTVVAVFAAVIRRRKR